MTATDTPPTLYKITAPDGGCYNGGHGRWDLPTATEPGAWWRVDGPIEACRNGLHVVDAAHVRDWIGADPFIIHRVETDGPIVEADGKYVVGAARLLPRKRPVRPAADLGAATRRNLRARAAASAALADATRGASGYLARVNVTLPEGHPLRAAQAGYEAAGRAYAETVRAADVAYAHARDRALRLEDV